MTDVAPATPPWAGDAAAATLCNFGTTGAAYAAAAAWGSAYTGQIWGVVGFGAASAALAAASAANGCYYPPPPEPPSDQQAVCCSKWSEPTAGIFWQNDDGLRVAGLGAAYSNRDALYSVTPRPDIPYPGDQQFMYYDFVASQEGGGGRESFRVNSRREYANSGCWTLHGEIGTCSEEGGDLPPGPVPPPEPVPIPDPETGCIWSTSMETAYLNAAGNMVIQYKATADDPEKCGGPIYWWEEAGKPPVIVQPDPTDPDKPIPPPEPLPEPCPDPCPDIPPPLELPEQIYKLTGICETVPDGQPQPEFEYQIPANRFEFVLSRKLDVIATMLQQHLALKTPTCQPEIQPLEGDYRTISFISDEKSPEGAGRLSKRFRYRSSSGIGLSGVVEHWRSFTWAAGAVIVTHTGSALGAPKVWAATAEEGKRVIRHAAGEAGVDADQVGRWIVSGSTDPRYGMPGTMRVNTKGGYYWITSRLGPDQRPLVQET